MVRLYLQLFVEGLMSYLCYLCFCVHSDVQCLLCCVFILFVCRRRLIYPMCQFLWIVYF